MKRSFKAGLKLIILLLLPVSLLAQAKNPPLFPADDPYFKNWGWLAGAGANYTLPTSGDAFQVVIDEAADQINTFKFSPLGKVGGMVEGGAFYIVDHFILRYTDAALRVNYLRGKEDFILQNQSISGGEASSSTGERSFDYMNVSLRLNANNTIQTSKYGFILNSFGLNLDYYFMQDVTSDPTLPLGFVDHDQLEFQLHYKLAYGFRLDLMHYLIIGVDTPVMQFTPWNEGRPSFNMFESSYLPLTLSVQILWLNKSNRPDCNKPAPIDMNKKRKKAQMF